ncbi:MAG: hypothetical protein ACE5DM_02575 [Candidatus Nanoarchaeia archaeon]
MEGKYRLRDVIDSLDHDELLRIKKDLESGGLHLKKFVHTKIIEHEKQHEQYCTTCSSKIDPNSTSTFTLIFGPIDFRKKATFCAMDCMSYFLKTLQNSKVQKNPNI